jgi:hypothetical protein
MPALAVVLTHGLHGTDEDFAYFEQSLVALFRQKFCGDKGINEIYVLRSKANNYKTHDGIKTMATRLHDETLRFISEKVLPSIMAKTDGRQDVLYFAFVGHSLGGLIGRYFVKLIMNNDKISQLVKSMSQGALDFVPLSFMTVATPHLGSRRPKTTDNLNDIMMSSIVKVVCANIIGQTGRELIMKDIQSPPQPVAASNNGSSFKMQTFFKEKKAYEEPTKEDSSDTSEQKDVAILQELARGNGKYMENLLKFKHCTTVAHLQDLVVSAGSSLLMPHHKFDESSDKNSLQILLVSGFEQEHMNLLSERASMDERGHTLKRHTSVTDKGYKQGPDVEYDPDVLAALESIPWRRLLVDYNLQNPFSRLFVHPSVIGKSFPGVHLVVKTLGEKMTDMLCDILLTDYVLEVNRVEA